MRSNRNFYIWLLSVATWVTLFYIAPDFWDNPIDHWYNVLPIIAYIGACSLGTFFLLYIVGCSRYVSAIVLPIIALTGATLIFYRVGYHATLTPMLIDVTLHTNPEEAIGVISWPLVIWIILNLGIAVVFILWRWKRITLPHAWIHACIALALGAGYLSCHPRIRNGLSQRFPYIIPYNVHEYFTLQHSIQEEREIPVYRAIDIPDSISIVLIIGEATRADHLQLNGYARETNPRLFERSNIVSYPHIYSEQTHTLVSLPYILTRADSVNDEYQYTETSFVSIFRQEEFKSAWISNQDLGSTFSPFLAECDTIAFANASKSVYVYSPWIDEELIPIMLNWHSLKTPRTICILHTIGSHWYYNNHVPDSMQYFQPVTGSRVVTANSVEYIINSYDNTIRYMDFFVDSVISAYEEKNALIIYQSDHGEALGEDGEYLHANDAAGVHNPACIVWYSDKYAAANPEKIKALIANKDKRYRTDYLFYSILYAAGIEAEGDCETMNIFR